MSAFLKWAAPAVLLGLVATNSRAATPYDAMLGRIPDQANLLLVFDNEAVQKSPLGVKHDWAKNYQKSALGGLFGCQPDIQRVVFASQLDHHTLQNQWSVGVAEMRFAVVNKDLVKSTHGFRDSVSGREATLTQQNSYLIPLDSKQLGMMSPANRQVFSRWVRTTGLRGGSRVSPFLRDSLDKLPKDAQALLALDLGDMFEEEGLRVRFKKSETLSKNNVDVEAATKLFSDIKGLTLALRIGKDIRGELRIQFNESPAFLQPVATKLLTSALAATGATIEDFNDWDATTEDKALVMRGVLSQSAVRKIFSPLSRPLPVFTEGNDLSPGSPAAASQRYFSGVNTLLDDLKDTKTQSLGQRSFWYKQFADQIDSLPMLGADDELLKYGASVSTALRAMANLSTNTSMQQQTINANTIQSFDVLPGTSYNYGNGPGWGSGAFFPAQATSNIDSNRNLINQARGTEVDLRTNTWKSIEAATVEIRRKMVQKFNVEF